MLAKVAPPTNDFQALARYLVHGKPGTRPDPRRVAWVIPQNLPTDDPALAAKYMEATAQLSARTKKAAYHLMIAWHANERPGIEAMQDVARQTLLLAGLGEHQALMMGHGDKPHPHLHILLNRVHPDTGRAWKTSHDFALIDRIMRELADAHGFAFVPAHTYNPELTDNQAKLPDTSATYAAKRGAPTSRPQWSRETARALGAELSEQLTQDSTADDVASMLADRGLRLETKGRGFVVGDDNSYAKLSSLGLTASAKALARLRAAAQSPLHGAVPSHRHHSTAFYVDAVDIVRAFMAWGLTDKTDLLAAIQDVQRERQSNKKRATTSTMLAPLIPPPKGRSVRLQKRMRARDPGRR